jgi:hypothetical protein
MVLLHSAEQANGRGHIQAIYSMAQRTLQESVDNEIGRREQIGYFCWL